MPELATRQRLDDRSVASGRKAGDCLVAGSENGNDVDLMLCLETRIQWSLGAKHYQLVARPGQPHHPSRPNA